MELLTVRESAELLRVTPITIRRYIAAGRLPAVRVGRGVRVRREAVEGLLEPVALAPADRTNPEVADEPEALTRSLLRLVGIAGANGADDGPTDVSSDKYKHLADVYAPQRP